MARNQKRDSRGRFASMGGGSVRSIKSDRTIKGGGEKKRGSTVASRNAQTRAGERLRVSEDKAFKLYHSNLAKLERARKSERKLAKTGAGQSAKAAAQQKTEGLNFSTALARQTALRESKTGRRRYRNEMGLVQQRRYAKPR